MNENSPSLGSVEEKLDEIARLLALNVKRDRSLQIAIAEMESVGFRPTRIAELLGTSAKYVWVAISRTKKGSKTVNSRPASED